MFLAKYPNCSRHPLGMVVPDRTLGLVTFQSKFKMRRDRKDNMFVSLSENRPPLGGTQLLQIAGKQTQDGKGILTIYPPPKKKKINGEEFHRKSKGNLGDRM